VCAICAMTAAIGVTASRSYLQTRRWNWLTQERLRRITIALCLIGLLASMFVVSGSTPG